MKADFDFGPDGDLWSSSGPATAQQKMSFAHQRRIAIALVRSFIDMAGKPFDHDLDRKAKAFLFDVDHA